MKIYQFRFDVTKEHLWNVEDIMGWIRNPCVNNNFKLFLHTYLGKMFPNNPLYSLWLNQLYQFYCKKKKFNEKIWSDLNRFSTLMVNNAKNYFTIKQSPLLIYIYPIGDDYYYFLNNLYNIWSNPPPKFRELLESKIFQEYDKLFHDLTRFLRLNRNNFYVDLWPILK